MKLEQLPVGARLRTADGTHSFYVACQDHPCWPGTVLFSEYVTAILPFDGAEPDSPRKKRFTSSGLYGYNRFEVSNLFGWLNSEDAAWYRPLHRWDAPPAPESCRNGAHGYDSRPGFLSTLPACLRNALLEVDVPILSGTENAPALTTFRAKVFLPSRTELGLGDDYGLAEGVPLPLFEDPRTTFGHITKAVFDHYESPWEPTVMTPSTTWRWWLRSPHLAYDYLVRYVSDWGGISYTQAWYDIVGVRPMMVADGGLTVSAPGLPGNIYILEEGGTEV